MQKEKGTYVATLRVSNNRGESSRPFKIVCGDALALTPPMAWTCFAGDASDERMRAAADALVSSGLSSHGWTYISINDGWQAGRDANGQIVSNQKFPDMRALADYVHSKGLKIGLYSSPGPKTCAGWTGSYQQEKQDARTYAEWEFDYLTYDWCSYGQLFPKPTHLEMVKPFDIMHAALNKTGRDIVFSLGPSDMGEVWKWAADVGANSWRTGSDTGDSWPSISTNGFCSAGLENYAGPGHWNNPGILALGQAGRSAGRARTGLQPDEQYTQVSLWCLLASPLVIGCDLAQLDDFTLSLLTNDEVLDVDQDELGRQAVRVAQHGQIEIWAKDLVDGSKAIGAFNRGGTDTETPVRWSDLGLTGPQYVRDLWRQQDLGKMDQQFSTRVRRHGVVLIRVGATPPELERAEAGRPPRQDHHHDPY
jgi:hypothetical protein